MMRLLADGVALSGRIELDGRDLLTLSEGEMCAVRGDRLSMVFQEPMTALNPVRTIGAQVAEPLIVHGKASREEARARAVELLDRVGIPDAAVRANHYPHQLSGGQRQRVVIAMALACGPAFIVADEPTTALDTTVQRQILRLLLELVDTTRAGLVVITHNLAVVSEIADRVLVMYAGEIVEAGSASNVLGDPSHPYTRGLLAALPTGPRERRLNAIPGTVPALTARGPGCGFANRCGFVTARCRERKPPLAGIGAGHEVRCFHTDRVRASGGADV